MDDNKNWQIVNLVYCQRILNSVLLFLHRSDFLLRAFLHHHFFILFAFICRCCPEIEKLYLLVRPKRGKQPRDRLGDMFDNPVSCNQNYMISKQVTLLFFLAVFRLSFTIYFTLGFHTCINKYDKRSGKCGQTIY